MYRVLVLIAVGCGRIGFAQGGDGGQSGHDEDGDGIPDLADVCPHIPGPQADRDGDGVGDACDPEPDNPRQHRALFAAMTPDDQPFELGDPGRGTQLPDALHLLVDGGEGVYDADVAYGSVQVTIGVVVEQVLGASRQHQLAIAPTTLTAVVPYQFGELNEGPGYSAAQLSAWDGSHFIVLSEQQLATGFHPGDVQLQVTANLGGTLVLDGGWPAEPYHVTAPGPWQGGGALRFDINNLVIDLDYVFVVSW